MSHAASGHDFDYDALRGLAHRPWPMPSGRWVMTQTWTDLLFAHWPVPASTLAPRIPDGLQLDLFDGQAWLGVVPFRMSNVAPRWTPALPGLSAFPELNVRTYVRTGDRPGVFFFSLDAANPVAVATARAFFRLPYYWASMSVDIRDEVVRYDSRRHNGDATPGRFVATYAPAGPVFHAQPGTLERFLTERYCLYTTWARTVLRVDIHHPPWDLQRANATFEVNTMAEAAGLRIDGAPSLLHFARRQDVVAWLPRRAEVLVASSRR